MTLTNGAHGDYKPRVIEALSIEQGTPPPRVVDRSNPSEHEDATVRVMQLVGGTGLNGAVRHCYELTCQLALRGHQVLLAHKPGAWIADNEFPAGVELLETSLLRNRQELPRMADEARRRQIDVIHSHLSSACFFGVLLSRLFGLRSVATSHTTLLQPHWWWNDRVIAPSESTARFQRWVNWVPRRRIDVVHNFIDTRRFQPTRPAAEIRKELAIDESSFVITVVGDVGVRKAQHVLVQAVPRLLAAGVNARVLLVGAVSPDYRPRIERDIERLGLRDRVTLLGRRGDIADLYQVTDCCCLSSNKEVMPIALLEAMSLGLPAVATDVGGVAECVRDGLDGFIVRPRRPDELAERLLRLALDPALRAELGANARRSMLERFSPEACLPKVVETYQLACGRRRPAPRRRGFAPSPAPTLAPALAPERRVVGGGW